MLFLYHQKTKQGASREGDNMIKYCMIVIDQGTHETTNYSFDTADDRKKVVKLFIEIPNVKIGLWEEVHTV